MKEFPETPPVEEAPAALLERGHLWLHELVDGAPIRVQALSDGRLRFGDTVRTFGDDVPPSYGHAARYVRERFDRGALREAVDDVESVVFFGYAMHKRSVDYDWDRVPNFLGSDVWSATAESYLLPDAVEKIYRRLGLESLTVVEAERRAADFDPDSYAFPPSAWDAGPVAGVLLRNKTGLRARLDNPAVGDEANTRREPFDAATVTDGTDEHAGSDAASVAETLARRHATDERFAAVADRLRAEGRPVTFDTLYERTVETIARAQHDRLFGGREDVEMRAFRSTVAALTRAYLADRT